ncbi:MAG: hypothetical protein GY867_09870 [bacterium]|nr:hypothetical protein [bacterium]
MNRTTTLALSLLALLICGSGFAYENPEYFTTRPHPIDGSCDTLAIFTCDREPQYMQTSTLYVRWIVRQEVTDSAHIVVTSGEVCHFNLDKYSHTWFGDFQPGDTLRCSFQFTPLTVGTMNFHLSYKDEGPEVYRFSFGFTLDENGRIVPGDRGHGRFRYGTLGPLPELIRDTLYFIGPCSYRVDFELGIQAKLWPKLSPHSYSNLEFQITPGFDLEQGIAYRLEATEQFEVIADNLEDWPQNVAAGDTLTIRLQIKPVRSGVGGFKLRVLGLGAKYPKESKFLAQLGGLVNKDFRITLVLDENLQVFASSKDNIPQLTQSVEGAAQSRERSDSYRMESIERLRSRNTYSVKHSNNYGTMQNEAKAIVHEIWMKH